MFFINPHIMEVAQNQNTEEQQHQEKEERSNQVATRTEITKRKSR